LLQRRKLALNFDIAKLILMSIHYVPVIGTLVNGTFVIRTKGFLVRITRSPVNGDIVYLSLKLTTNGCYNVLAPRFGNQ